MATGQSHREGFMFIPRSTTFPHDSGACGTALSEIRLYRPGAEIRSVMADGHRAGTESGKSADGRGKLARRFSGTRFWQKHQYFWLYRALLEYLYFGENVNIG